MSSFRPTAQDRLIVRDYMFSVQDKVERCFSILNIILSDFFEDAEPKKLGVYETEKLETLIRSASDEAADAIEEYYFITGDDTGTDFASCQFERAEKAILARDVERLLQAADQKTRDACILMDDEDAIRALKGK